MIKKVNKETRNLGVTVVAGCIAITAALFAYSLFPTDAQDIASIAYFAGAAFVALLALIVAVYGRKSALKNLIEGMFNFSS